MKLLVPVDGSSASVEAAKMAAKIAKKENASVKMLYVVKNYEYELQSARLQQKAEFPLSSSYFVSSLDLDGIMEKMKSFGEKTVDDIYNQADFSGVPVEKAVLFGDPYEEIVNMAKGDEVDLIVMGNRGFSKIVRFFVGSVTQRVISEAPCPVLVIHSEKKD